jgi:hypothetical protein
MKLERKNNDVKENPIVLAKVLSTTLGTKPYTKYIGDLKYLRSIR